MSCRGPRVQISSPALLLCIKDLNEHPNDYIGKTVTVKGFYSSYSSYSGRYTVKDEDENKLYACIYKGLIMSTLIKGREYLWTGKIVQDGSSIKLMLTEIKPS